MPRFPSNFIDDLKAQADIVQVIQDAVPLKKAGNSYKGLCPFHGEKTPSFHVNRDKGFFHCFGCATGGDVLKFVELHEKLSFPEAVQLLAQRFGLQIPESDDPERDRLQATEREGLLKIHDLAHNYFREQLTGRVGTHVRTYLEERGVLRDTVSTLGLGFALPQRDALTKYLLDNGQPLNLLLKSGLVVERDGGRMIDRFRNRLMIPISRDTGQVIAFGGRALASDQQPKYVNSPETALYTKGRTLYGLNLTKQDVRRLGYAVLVEGYFDFAQALQAGVSPVVATCGTALSEKQVRLLRRFTDKVLLSFDPDSAGESATLRSGELLLSENFQVNVVLLAHGEDPDTFIRNHGAKQYSEKLRTSRPYLDYVMDEAAKDRDLTKDGDRRAFLKNTLTIASRIPDPASRDQFADRLAHRAQIMEDVIRTEIRRTAIERRTEIKADVVSTKSTIRPAEKGLIWATMHTPERAQSVLSDLESEDFEGLSVAPILEVAKTLATIPPDAVPQTLLDRLREDEVALVNRIAADTTAPAKVEDCAVNLKQLRYERERIALQDEIDRLQQKGSVEALNSIDSLLEKKRDLLRRLDKLTR